MNSYDEYYPRPLLQRDSFFSLNGEWLLNGKKINVPFCRESRLSGYENDKNTVMEYEKRFILPEGFHDEKKLTILHFGAVDQKCDVFLNDIFLAHNEGGYLPFEADISSSLRKENILKVVARDELDPFYPYGKQSKDPHGMWYTPVSGIWQSVWIEERSEDAIKDLHIHTDTDKVILDIDSDAEEFFFQVKMDEETIEKRFTEKHFELDLSQVKRSLWSNDSPKLYEFTLKTENDEIRSYFALRKLSVKEVGKHKRLFLNDEPVFLNGVLDQGYFPEGIFTPEDVREYERDILSMKELGYNFIRKHIKVEPEAFYYYCDKHGILVMQDMVNSGEYSFFRDTALPTIGLKRKTDKVRDQRVLDFFLYYSQKTIRHLSSHPCIIAYTIYNEGWGQQASTLSYRTLKQEDPDRLFDTASGWFRGGASDFDSEHIYFRNSILMGLERVLLLSECGGYTRKIEGHVYKEDGKYGYGKTESEEELTSAIIRMHEKMTVPSIRNGLCGVVMTQLSDIEEEINGLYTYDRKVCKVNKQRIIDENLRLQKLYRECIEKGEV